MRDRASFDAFVSAAVRPLEYVHGNSPRSRLTKAVYTSTEYPPEFQISLHNELSYAAQWPRYVLFFCSQPPQEGGETPLVDSHELCEELPPELVQRFESHGVLYVRNLHSGQGLGPSWMKTFGTDDRSCVERLCEEGRVRFAWHSDGSLKVWERRPATRIHPDTGQRVWFNQADQFHPTNHPPVVCESLRTYYRGRETDMPHYCLLGDGKPIPDADLEQVRTTTARLATAFSWQQGDVLLVDNMKAAHGRNAYRGAREVLVSMF